MNAIEVLRKYVDKQKSLVEAVVSGFDEHVDEFTFKAKLSPTIDAIGETWNVAAHGVGVRFTNNRNGEVIDAHVGVLDGPEIFDVWRIEEHLRSLKKPDTIGVPWSQAIERLAQEGMVKRHPTYRNHFVLA